MPEFDLAAVYRTARERLLELAPTLSSDQLTTIVPTCPAWTVHNTYAHLTGLAAEVTSGDAESPGSPQSTARQVATRKDATIAEICEEWRQIGPDMDAVLAATPSYRAPAIDAWTHDQDIHNALGMVSGRAGPGLELTVSGVWRLKRGLREASLAPLRVVTPARDWVLGDGEPAAVLRIDDYELARAFLGRRSLRQMRSYDWEGDPEPYLLHFPVFTPPTDDIVE